MWFTPALTAVSVEKYQLNTPKYHCILKALPGCDYQTVLNQRDLASLETDENYVHVALF